MVGQAAKGKAAVQRSISLPSLVAPERAGQALQKEFDLIEDTLVALQAALQDKNVQLTATLLKRLEGARYMTSATHGIDPVPPTRPKNGRIWKICTTPSSKIMQIF